MPSESKSKKNDGPKRIGEGPFVHPGDGKGSAGLIAERLNISFEDATKKLGEHYGDVNAILATAGKVIAQRSLALNLVAC